MTGAGKKNTQSGFFALVDDHDIYIYIDEMIHMTISKRCLTLTHESTFRDNHYQTAHNMLIENTKFSS